MKKLRKCQYPKCKEEARRTYCSDKKHNTDSAKRERARINKEKKERYYKKHGIVHKKQLRRNPKVTKGVAPTDFTLVYSNYKEPLTKVENGYGYQGTLAQTDDRKYVQCHICGNLFESLGTHISAHRLTAREYKQMFELTYRTALVSDEYREKLQQHVKDQSNNYGKAIPKGGPLPKHLQEYNAKVRSGEIDHGKYTKWSLETRNKLGVCPDQVLVPLRQLAEQLGHTPTLEEYIRYNNGYKHKKAIAYHYGTYLGAVKAAGMKSAQSVWSPTNDDLLNDLKQFNEKYGRIPMTSDFNRGLLRNRGIYISRFGSLNNARIQAGLNAVLPLPFGQYKEMTPDEYIEYKSGRQGKTKKEIKAENQRRWRAARKAQLIKEGANNG